MNNLKLSTCHNNHKLRNKVSLKLYSGFEIDFMNISKSFGFNIACIPGFNNIFLMNKQIVDHSEVIYQKLP